MKNYNELFTYRFDKSQQIDEEFCKLYNRESLKSAVSFLKKLGATSLLMDDYHIKYRVSEWTKDTISNRKKLKLLNELKNLKKYILDVNIKENSEVNVPELNIETTLGTIKVIKLSEFFPTIKEAFPFIENDGRFGKCYDFANTISLNLGIPNKLVTGYVYGYSDKSYFLHSWVEANIKGKQYVIDGTLNAIINKEGYYLMQHAKPISTITSKDLLLDQSYLEKIKSVPLEVYYVFRNEIINDLNKNQKIFVKEKN